MVFRTIIIFQIAQLWSHIHVHTHSFLSSLCLFFALALSSSLPLSVLACVCTVRYCGNTSRLRKKKRGGGWPCRPNLMYSVWVSVREKEGEKNSRAENKRAVYSSDSQDTERDASNEKSHRKCLLFSHPAVSPPICTLWAQPSLRIAWGELHLTAA